MVFFETNLRDPKLPFSLLLSNYPSIPNYNATFDLGDLVCTELVTPLTTTYRYAISRVPITTGVVSLNLDQGEVYNIM